MKVLLLGGCADMAGPLLSKLADDNTFTEVTVADLNKEKAEEIAGKNPKFKSVYVDANDHSLLVNLMREHDFSICYIGPFYYYEKKMVKAALEAARDYISISDDYDAYIDILNLEEEACTKDIKILTGFGNSPGLTQVLAKKGYLALDKPEKINVHWCAGSDESVGPSNLAHLFHIFTGTTLQWLNSNEVRVKTGAGKKMVHFLDPIGLNPVYYTGHAESVSLPRNLPGLTEVTLHGGVKPPYIVTLLKLLAALGLTSNHKKRLAAARFFHRIESWFASSGNNKSVGRVDVSGQNSSGQNEQVSFCYVGHIADITSLPCYLAAKWLAEGKWNQKPGGIYAAERLIDNPDQFIDDLENLGVTITNSWER